MANGVFGGGDGTELNPFLVEDVHDLNSIRNNLSAYYKQTADIKMELSNWIVLGDYNESFNGYFDGDKYGINNMKIDGSNNSFLGLFGVVENATLINITLNNINIVASSFAGALVGQAKGNNIITNCSANGNLVGGYHVGGLIGDIEINGSQATIEKCHSSVTLSSNAKGGGLIGALGGYSGGGVIDIISCTIDSHLKNIESGVGIGGLIGEFNPTESTINITDCSFNGDIEDSAGGSTSTGGLIGEYAASDCNVKISKCFVIGSLSSVVTENGSIGGFIGSSSSSNGVCEIINSYSVADISTSVTGSANVGGLLGVLMSGILIKITNCYAAGSLYGGTNRGGLIGAPYGFFDAIITNSYFDSDTSNQNELNKGVAKTTVEMMQKATFVDWDFDTVWRINDGKSYPVLFSESDPEPVLPYVTIEEFIKLNGVWLPVKQ